MRSRLRALRLVLDASFAADRRLTLGMLAVFVGEVVMTNIFILVLRAVTDAMVRGDAEDTLLLVMLLSVPMALWPFIWRCEGSFSLTLRERTSREFERRLLADAVARPGLWQHEDPAHLDDMRMLRAQMRDLANTFSLTMLIRAVGLLGTSIVLLVSIDPLCGLLVLFAIPAVLLGDRVERRRIAAEADVVRAQRLRQRLFELQVEPRSAKEIKVLGLGEELRRRHREAWASAIRAGDRTNLGGAAILLLGWSIFVVGMIGALWLLVWRASRGEVTAGDLMLFIAVSHSQTTHISDTLDAVNSVRKMLSAADRFLSVEARAERMSGSGRAEPRRHPPARIHGGIAFEGVSFTYPGTAVEILSDVSFELRAGSVVAIVGENGAGKTTLVKLLGRLYEPTRGRVTLDGVDLDAYDLSAWRSRLSAGFQDFVRFELLARESVGVGDLAAIDDVATVRRALDAAGSADLELRLPDGLETQLGAIWRRGVDLSGGQWQRLALGRALMREAPLLLMLDEPTASLDAATEHEIFNRFAAAARSRRDDGSITLFVSHRFSTVRTADLIVVMEHGRVAEIGSHADLMRAKGGYATLYELQANAYSDASGQVQLLSASAERCDDGGAGGS